MPIGRRNLVLFASFLASQGLAATAFAQDWPSKSIVIIVPFPPGGSADLSARFLAERLKTAFGQPVVVGNKIGAGGNLAATEIAARVPRSMISSPAGLA
jgi:tripartite-type tricarboxylate transporter receptor subunit TctC